MKKWYLSKTILVAMAMEALAQVTLHMEEVKTAIASHTNTDAGLAFAISFPAVMVMMRFITTKPIEGVKKNVQDNGADQNMDNNGVDGGDRDARIMGLIPQILGDTDTGGGEEGTASNNTSKKQPTPSPKRRGRGKRRR